MSITADALETLGFPIVISIDSPFLGALLSVNSLNCDLRVRLAFMLWKSQLICYRLLYSRGWSCLNACDERTV